MSFSATILFSPPNATEAKCSCKQEPGAQAAAPPLPPSSCTPITVSGSGLAVQSSDQLLHVIYQRVEKAVSLAEVALGLAKANNEALRRLEEEMGALRRGAPPALKASPLCIPEEGQQDDVEEEEGEQEAEGFRNGVQVVIEELRQLGAAAGPPGHLGFSPVQLGTGGLGGAAEAPPAGDVSMQHGRATASSPAPQMLHQPPLPALEDPLSCPEVSPNSATLEDPLHGEQRLSLGFASLHCRSQSIGQKNARRKRDLVLSKLVHNVHNHITNDKRFDGSESIKSSWNISVVKFLLEKLKQELMSNHHNYTDKELKGACVAYFLTKRREYRNSLNPFKGLKEKEEKKLRSRRYRLFANRLGVARLLGPEEQRVWQGVTEEFMSDEEDSLSEPGVWVARPPRFRAAPLTQLCYRLDANSKHGTKANRVYGPPSDRLPSAEAQLLPQHLYNPHFQEEEGRAAASPHPPSHKGFCPDLSSFVEIKVEKDE
ncbi:hypothetical protein EYD10_17243 [Varanus komodoensis]|uniref:uncharacterized protein C14orf93 homolog n=1 Tax=Varanus komodoensis TaxID=61221 RepID=UPI001CF774CD|nr:uncharacterized protein C14orf93 homolog [Varanus komodoensis]KAF7235946.1 hypothetical protein EYD10_17243 [Varanus komodoensis]